MEPRRGDEREAKREGGEEKVASSNFLARDAARLDEDLEKLAHAVIGAAIEVHRLLGPGLPELVYRNALSHEFSLRSIEHQVEAPVPVSYKGMLVGAGRVDLLVSRQLVVELKVVDQLGHLHRSQVIAYLSAMHLQLGLLMNFNVAMLADGIRRVILTRS
jgi:GxxExxY protein